MLDSILYKDCYKDTSIMFVDMRSPSEHEHACIPNSINIPLFSDEEREIVGTIYKQKNADEAKQVGIEFVSKRLPHIFSEFTKISRSGHKIVVYCARGGMRSSSISSLLKTLGFRIDKLNFGYKGYRSFVNENLEKEINKVKFITLFGKTGTGKTNILNELENMGVDVLDLEKCANHRGSLLGLVGIKKQNSQQQFEALVLDKILNRKTDIMFTEGESKRIGRIIMPTFLYDKVHETGVLVESPMEYRVENIRNEYILKNFNEEEILNTLDKLNKYISQTKIDEYKENIQNKNFDFVIEELMANYYDNSYKVSEMEKSITNVDNKKAAEDIIKLYKDVLEQGNTNLL